MKNCIKCGGGDHEVIHIRQGYEIGARYGGLIARESVFVRNNYGNEYVVIKEHLRVTCNTCGYTHARDTLDNASQSIINRYKK